MIKLKPQFFFFDRQQKHVLRRAKKKGAPYVYRQYAQNITKQAPNIYKVSLQKQAKLTTKKNI